MIRRIKNLYHLLTAIFWTYRCGYPAKKLYVIGITGTDGKTTTSTLIYEIIKAAGYKAGLLSTVAAKVGDREIDTGLHTTNPGPEVLQPILKRAVESGVTHMVLEVTSHGLDQNRVWGCNFRVGVLTNITHEHLDYHKTMARYMVAKAKLFNKVKYAVLNRDDPGYGNFKALILNLNSDPELKIIDYTKAEIGDISPALAGDYNKYNIAAAIAVARILKIQDLVINKVIRKFRGVPGRREEVVTRQDFRVVVDFAHTPNALSVLLVQLRKELKEKGRLIAVFGCTGERDKEKRPMMGGIAAKLSDIMIITSDDTRGENQDEIYKQIISGVSDPDLRKEKRTLFKENNRRKAIRKAVEIAKSGDIVVIAGKGHEKSLLLGRTEIPWSDAEVARDEMKKL